MNETHVEPTPKFLDVLYDEEIHKQYDKTGQVREVLQQYREMVRELADENRRPTEDQLSRFKLKVEDAFMLLCNKSVYGFRDANANEYGKQWREILRGYSTFWELGISFRKLSEQVEVGG